MSTYIDRKRYNEPDLSRTAQHIAYYRKRREDLARAANSLDLQGVDAEIDEQGRVKLAKKPTIDQKNYSQDYKSEVQYSQVGYEDMLKNLMDEQMKMRKAQETPTDKATREAAGAYVQRISQGAGGILPNLKPSNNVAETTTEQPTDVVTNNNNAPVAEDNPLNLPSVSLPGYNTPKASGLDPITENMMQTRNSQIANELFPGRWTEESKQGPLTKPGGSAAPTSDYNNKSAADVAKLTKETGKASSVSEKNSKSKSESMGMSEGAKYEDENIMIKKVSTTPGLLAQGIEQSQIIDETEGTNPSLNRMARLQYAIADATGSDANSGAMQIAKNYENAANERMRFIEAAQDKIGKRDVYKYTPPKVDVEFDKTKSSYEARRGENQSISNTNIGVTGAITKDSGKGEQVKNQVTTKFQLGSNVVGSALKNEKNQWTNLGGMDFKGVTSILDDTNKWKVKTQGDKLIYTPVGDDKGNRSKLVITKRTDGGYILDNESYINANDLTGLGISTAEEGTSGSKVQGTFDAFRDSEVAGRKKISEALKISEDKIGEYIAQFKLSQNKNMFARNTDGSLRTDKEGKNIINLDEFTKYLQGRKIIPKGKQIE